MRVQDDDPPSTDDPTGPASRAVGVTLDIDGWVGPDDTGAGRRHRSEAGVTMPDRTCPHRQV
ncbi:MAG: hypothetical protein WBP61_06725 [Nocardioides sp.]